MRQNLIAASVVAALLLLWLLSGIIWGANTNSNHANLAEQNESMARERQQQVLPVRAQIIQAQPRTRYLVMRGKTQSKLSVEVKAEIAGRVVERPVERGDAVKRGALLCQLKINEHQAALAEMKAALEQAEIDYRASLKLKKQGLQSETAIAQAATGLAAAKTNVRRAQLALGATQIVAPFDGVVEQLHMDIGDYATVGSPCATVISLDPMLVTADVTEIDVDKIKIGNTVSGTTSSGQSFGGRISFIGKQSDPLTRTYPVEITVANAEHRLRSGLSATVRVAVDEVLAQRVSPALFTLDDSGRLGIRTIDDNNRVQFVALEIIEDTVEGVWVSGLPARAHIITVGQEFVSAGQLVEPVYPGSDPAATARLQGSSPATVGTSAVEPQ